MAIFIEEKTVSQATKDKLRLHAINHGDKYNLFHKDMGLLIENISKVELREIHHSLVDFNGAKSKVLGSTKSGKSRLMSLYKFSLIGLYSILIP